MASDHPDTTEQRLRRALSLAVAMLSPYQPGDSRAVPDEFVALACVDCGDEDDRVWDVIDRGLEKVKERADA